MKPMKAKKGKFTMMYVRITSYYQSGKFTSCEHLYPGNDQVKALERFRKDFPHHNDCILVAETISDEDSKYEEYIHTCWKCGCVG